MSSSSQPLQQLDPRKVSYLVIERHRAAQAGKALGPYALEVQPTYACNYRCTHCAYLDRNERWQAQLSDANLDGLVLSVRDLGTKWVYISGGGEPLVRPYVRECFTRFSWAGAKVALLTNGSLLEYVDARQLQALSYIQVSIPAVDRELYRQITGQDRLDAVLGIPESIKARCRDSRPQLTAAFVVTQANARTVAEASKVILGVGYDLVKFRRAEDYETGLAEADWDHERTNLGSLFFRRGRRDRCAALDLGLLATVNPEGDVFRCLLDVGRPDLSIGNVKQKPLADIWRYQPSHVAEWLQARYAAGRCSAACRCHRYNDLFDQILPLLPESDDLYPAA